MPVLASGAPGSVAPRCTAGVKIVSAAMGISLPIPHWTTGRLWLLRLGHALLTMALDKSNDWAWLVDHSVQIGQEKCLVILGIRLKDLPEQGECLQHSDLHLVALVPRKSWTRQEVDEALEAASQRTGVPRVIVDDHGVDIAGGVSFFQERIPKRSKSTMPSTKQLVCSRVGWRRMRVGRNCSNGSDKRAVPFNRPKCHSWFPPLPS